VEHARYERPGELLRKGCQLGFFDIVPLKYSGWAAYKKGVQQAFFDKISAGKLTPNNDLTITRRGGIAWMTLTFHLSFTLKTGAAIELDCRHTAVWENRGGKWLIVHEHISAPLPG
jgi:ketosteroid isomerase-like protein